MSNWALESEFIRDLNPLHTAQEYYVNSVLKGGKQYYTVYRSKKYCSCNLIYPVVLDLDLWFY